jgi:cobalt/nickel transport system permease protein
MINQQLPSWLTTTQHTDLPIVKSSWRRGDYLEKTLDDIGLVMAEDMYQDGISKYSGLLQRLHPLVKIIGCAVLLILAGVTHNFGVLAGIHLSTLFLILCSGMRVNDYRKRVLIPAFVFSGIAVLPAIFNWITPGDTLAVLYQGRFWHIGSLWLPEELTITKQGLKAAVFVIMRAATSLVLILAVVKTTRWAILTKSLGKLGIPAIFIMVIDLTYRYLFLFLLLLNDYILGRKSRLLGRERTQSQWGWIGSAIAGFFRMCMEYSREVSAAMVARGYDGENHQVIQRQICLADVCFLGVIITICILYGMQ